MFVTGKCTICVRLNMAWPLEPFTTFCENAREQERKRDMELCTRVLEAEAPSPEAPAQGRAVVEAGTFVYIQEKWDIYSEKDFREKHLVNMDKVGFRPNVSIII